MIKQLAALAALACVAAPAGAFDLSRPAPGVTFYLSLPLDGRAPKEQAPAFGIMVRGEREYHALAIDTRMLSFLPLGGIEAKWVIAGVVAAGTALAVASRDKSTSTSYNEQQNQQQQACASTPGC
jgi:hypothetical protein